ncbi:MAG TPA: hypothetical protein VIV11_06795 [Kofleriaceae bacterium]
MAYEDALAELYQAPNSQFVAERKRLAADLKAAGDAAGAKRLADRKRPTVSAWVVNQLYWHARDAFDEMLATAEQLRKGHLKASAAHREAIAKLRKRAAALLEDSGHAATEATLRRVTTTLSALAATGGFDPDLPGTLAADRDPPGFEAVGLLGAPDDEAEPEAEQEDEKPAAKPAAKPSDGTHDLDRARAARKQKEDDEADERRRVEMAEKKREEEARKRKAAERHRYEAALRTAKGDLDAAERKVKQVEKQLEQAQKDVAKAEEAIEDIQAQIAKLDED